MTPKASIRIALSVLATAAALTLVGCASEPSHYHDKIELSAAPQPVQAAVKQAVGAGKLEKLTVESEDGQLAYEAEIEGDNDHDRTLKFSPTGQLLEEETEIDLKDAPAPVVDALKAKYPNAEIEDIELVKESGQTAYEAKVEKGDMKHEVKLDPSGKILEDECKCEEKKDKDHDKGEKHDKD
jgi:uncharacterized membrane protein YkoI